MNGPLLDGRYDLLETLGTGGEARIFLARDAQTGEEVALRVGLEPARLNDLPVPSGPYAPGWVRLLWSGTDSDVGAYHVMERLEGRTLDKVVGDRAMPLPAWREFAGESFAAVKALHAAGLVHGDVHAENLFFDDAAARWKLLELPFLRFQPPEGRSALFGSIYTMAPEQIDGAAASRETDLYALGCLYYYAATGRYPHQGATEAEVAIAKLRDDVVPLGEANPAFPAEAAERVMGLLSRRAGMREFNLSTRSES